MKDNNKILTDFAFDHVGLPNPSTSSPIESNSSVGPAATAYALLILAKEEIEGQ
jgi:hypothetical protein